MQLEIQLQPGYKLAAEQNSDPNFSRELIIGVKKDDGSWVQDLAIIRNAYSINDGKVTWDDKTFEMLIYADEQSEDYTDLKRVGLYEDEDEYKPEQSAPPAKTALKTCPICKGPAKRQSASYHNDFLGFDDAGRPIYKKRKWFVVKCAKCGLSQPKRTYATREKSDAAWNNRA